jgi:predicted DNA-binding transcriptional regulator YafY
MNHKNPYSRCEIIHAELKKGTFVTKERLAKRLGVSIRTIDRDILYMKKLGAPIETKDKYGLYYTDLSYELKKKPTLREAWEIVSKRFAEILEEMEGRLGLES